MPDNSSNSSNVALILDSLVDIKTDIKSIESKLDVYSRQQERHDAQIETLSKQITQFVPMNVLDERRVAYDKRLVEVEQSVKDIERKQDDRSDKNVTRGLSVCAMLVAGIVGILSYFHHDPPIVISAPSTQPVQRK